MAATGTAEHNIPPGPLAPCPGDQEGPSVSGVGMAIVGDDDVTIRENVTAAMWLRDMRPFPAGSA